METAEAVKLFLEARLCPPGCHHSSGSHGAQRSGVVERETTLRYAACLTTSGERHSVTLRALLRTHTGAAVRRSPRASSSPRPLRLRGEMGIITSLVSVDSRWGGGYNER